MRRKKDILPRINSRVSKEQLAFIKREARKLKIGEGEFHRIIIDEYIKNHNDDL
jgi:hypothetical protein